MKLSGPVKNPILIPSTWRENVYNGIAYQDEQLSPACKYLNEIDQQQAKLYSRSPANYHLHTAVHQVPFFSSPQREIKKLASKGEQGYAISGTNLVANASKLCHIDFDTKEIDLYVHDEKRVQNIMLVKAFIHELEHLNQMEGNKYTDNEMRALAVSRAIYPTLPTNTNMSKVPEYALNLGEMYAFGEEVRFLLQVSRDYNNFLTREEQDALGVYIDKTWDRFPMYTEENIQAVIKCALDAWSQNRNELEKLGFTKESYESYIQNEYLAELTQARKFVLDVQREFANQAHLVSANIKLQPSFMIIKNVCYARDIEIETDVPPGEFLKIPLQHPQALDAVKELSEIPKMFAHFDGDIYSLYIPAKTELSLNQQRLVNMWGSALGATEYPVAKSIPDAQQVQQDATKDAVLDCKHESHEQEEHSDELNGDDER